VADIPSPGLLFYPDRIEENIRRMIAIAGGVQSLRPHVKTHKNAEITRMQMAQGIARFKTATIAETEMVAACGAPDVLLAYQPVGPNVRRLRELVRRFPATRFAALADTADALHRLSAEFSPAKSGLDVLLDIDCGMHRTGIEPGPAAVVLYGLLSKLPGLRAAGLHAYDGQIHDADPVARAQRCEEAFAPVLALRARLHELSSIIPPVVAGGTPTFPMHARRADAECSPGTCLLWDAGYAAKLPDLDFQPAALVLTRVISKPGEGRLCLDLGHKAVAAENPPPRVRLLGLPDAKPVTHSEEHLVVETPLAARFSVGDCLYGIPWHICPTVALHSHATVVKEGRAEGSWNIVARERCLTI
jgi:D-threonine aldolase